VERINCPHGGRLKLMRLKNKREEIGVNMKTYNVEGKNWLCMRKEYEINNDK
jgi:hypothetical protein